MFFTLSALFWRHAVVSLKAIWNHFQPQRIQRSKWAVYGFRQKRKSSQQTERNSCCRETRKRCHSDMTNLIKLAVCAQKSMLKKEQCFQLLAWIKKYHFHKCCKPAIFPAGLLASGDIFDLMFCFHAEYQNTQLWILNKVFHTEQVCFLKSR